MFILRCSYDNFVTEENIYCTGWPFYIFMNIGINSKNYEFGWHYALLTVWEKNWEIANVKHCYAHCERIDRNSYS
jgi:hypothetical protein